MSLKWRWAFAALVVVTLIGGFMPQALLSGVHSPGRTLAVSEQEGPRAPFGCADPSCGKGAPAPAVPSMTLAALVAAAAVLVAVAASRVTRRPRPWHATLPSGVAVSLFHPPQFS